MKCVRHILDTKGSQVFTVNEESTIFEALQIMAEKDVGALLVKGTEGISGIFSERDYARKVTLKGKSSREMRVSEIMSPNVIYVTPDQNIENCMALMIEKRIRHLPVMDNEKVAGLISIGDVVKALLDEKEFVIDQLVHYITGR